MYRIDYGEHFRFNRSVIRDLRRKHLAECQEVGSPSCRVTII